MELFDSHSHYNDEKFEQDKEQILDKVYKTGVTKLVCAGYNLEASKKAVEIAKAHDFVYATVGISPNDIENLQVEEFEQYNKIKQEKELNVINENTKEEIKENTKEKAKEQIKQNINQNLQKQLEKIEELAKCPKVVAIGEIGLDYYWNKENKEAQKIIFKKQIDLANKLNLPIVIHTREAIFDTLEILKANPAINKGVFHCCPLNLDLIREGLKLGFYISFAGPITFKNSKNAVDAINAVPLDKILIETDSPYLAPEPKRGTRNDSSNVIYIAEKIATVKGLLVEKIAKITYENAERIFKV